MIAVFSTVETYREVYGLRNPIYRLITKPEDTHGVRFGGVVVHPGAGIERHPLEREAFRMACRRAGPIIRVRRET